jgi:hypothetical protein
MTINSELYNHPHIRFLRAIGLDSHATVQQEADYAKNMCKQKNAKEIYFPFLSRIFIMRENGCMQVYKAGEWEPHEFSVNCINELKE